MQDPTFKVAASIFGVSAFLKVSALAAAVAILSLGGSAHAGSLGRPCTSAPENQWLSIQQLQAKVEASGYKVRNAKLRNACGELYALDKNGARVELFVDPTSGQVVGQL
jgi:hypothetical protein